MSHRGLRFWNLSYSLLLNICRRTGLKKYTIVADDDERGLHLEFPDGAFVWALINSHINDMTFLYTKDGEAEVMRADELVVRLTAAGRTSGT